MRAERDRAIRQQKETLDRDYLMSLLHEIDYKVSSAIEEALAALCKVSQPNFCLLIARAGVQPMLENIGKSRYEMDNAMDVYHDETHSSSI